VLRQCYVSVFSAYQIENKGRETSRNEMCP
jgi:hypothetical protein